MKTDTPETDGAWDAVSRTPDGMYDSRVPIKEYAYAMIEHSRNMERERDEARELLCVAMDWVYYSNENETKRRDLIERFEKLELTPSSR